MGIFNMKDFGIFYNEINGKKIKITTARGFEQVLILDENHKVLSEITVPNKIRGTVKIHELKRSFPNGHKDEYFNKYPIEVGDVQYLVYTHPDGGKSLSGFTIGAIL